MKDDVKILIKELINNLKKVITKHISIKKLKDLVLNVKHG